MTSGRSSFTTTSIRSWRAAIRLPSTTPPAAKRASSTSSGTVPLRPVRSRAVARSPSARVLRRCRRTARTGSCSPRPETPAGTRCSPHVASTARTASCRSLRHGQQQTFSRCGRSTARPVSACTGRSAVRSRSRCRRRCRRWRRTSRSVRSCRGCTWAVPDRHGRRLYVEEGTRQ
jgi:hypothetical protein